MKKNIITVLFLMLAIVLQAQNTENQALQLNSSSTLLSSHNKLVIGGYGEIHYNQPFDAEMHKNGTLDVHRMVVLFGFNFSEKTKFITEIEYEHISDVYIEQAFVQHQLIEGINLRAGLMLIPMGIVNELHEPTSFFGVERPSIDSKISPTTWREIGIGISGTSIASSLRYQAYLVNGFSSYSDAPMLNGKNGLRNGRQKGIESFITTPNLTARLEYFGAPNLVVGASGYFGKTQTSLYNNLLKDNPQDILKADSSRTGVAMTGLDLRYTKAALRTKAQLYYTVITNTEAYNIFTANKGKTNDLGSAMIGYYIELGYNIFKHIQGLNQDLTPFIRYEKFDTHFKTEGGLAKNDLYNQQIVVVGLEYFPIKGVVFKADMQFSKTKAAEKYSKVLNAGVGILF
jgi:hypothetical protein